MSEPELAASLLYAHECPEEAWRHLSSILERHPAEGEAHAQRFTVSCVVDALQIRSEGSGATRRAAEQVAAERALAAVPGS